MTYELVIFGVTGYTGKKVAEALSKKITSGVDPLCPKSASAVAFAGRDRGKLEELVNQLAAKYPKIGKYEIIIADISDVKSIDEMVKQTKAVIDLVGPFAKFGTPVVEACVKNGVHFCDVTGETNWNREMIDRFDELAKKNKALVVSFCGMDSIPFDLPVVCLVDYVRKKYNVGVGVVQSTLSVNLAWMSGGTTYSLMGVGDVANKKDILDDYYLNPRDDPQFPPGAKPRKLEERRRIFYDDDSKMWLCEFFMSPINTKVVRRSWRLYEKDGQSYGPGFLYRNEGMGVLAPRNQVVNAILSVVAFILFAMLYLIELSLSLESVRSFIRKYGPQPGQGPPQWMIDRTHTLIRVVGEIDDPKATTKKKAVAELRGREVGYFGTSEMLVECGLLLAAKKARAEGGVVTPAYAFGPLLAERFNQYTSVKIKVSDV
jgi:short subunit dehydrogenase-like uncharacterized protein